VNVDAGHIGGRSLEPPSARELAALRVQAARSNRAWHEVKDDIVPRPPTYYVSASSDETYWLYRGATFSGGRLEFAADAPLAFIVRDGDVIVLEPVGRKWSDIHYERERRHAKAAR
jgi:hypothetical protein